MTRPVYLDVARVRFLLRLRRCRAYSRSLPVFDYLGGEFRRVKW